MKWYLFTIGIMSIMLDTVLAAQVPKIGYGSSTAVVTAKIQESFLMGFELGFEKILGTRHAGEILSIKQVADGTPLGSTRSAGALLAEGALALVGFPGSHDSLLVADIAQKNEMLAVFTGSGHSDLAKKGNTVFTTGATMQASVEAVLEFISRVYPGKKGLGIINPYAVFSINHEKILRDLTSQNKYPKIKIDLARLNKEMILESDVIEALKRKNYDYLFITPYPEELSGLFNQFEEHQIDFPMLAGSSWGTADPEIMRRYLVKMNSPFFMAAEWIKGQKESLEFEKLLRKRYGREPISEIAFGYDVGIISGTTVERVKGQISKLALVSAFHQNLCFSGLTIGRMCFNPRGGHSFRRIHMLRFDKEGFRFVEVAY